MAQYSKLIPTILGILGQLLALGVFHGTALHYAQVTVAVLTAVGVFLAPKNKEPLSPTQAPTAGH